MLGKDSLSMVIQHRVFAVMLILLIFILHGLDVFLDILHILMSIRLNNAANNRIEVYTHRKLFITTWQPATTKGD